MKICHITSIHSPFDVRIFHKECKSLARAGHEIAIIAPADVKEQVVEGIRVLGISRSARRWQRARIWGELIGKISHLQPDVVHFHDPDLLLLALFVKGCHLIYDCHERNAVAMLNKPWLPKLLRRPAYQLVSFLEPALARKTAAIILVDDSQLLTFQKTGKPLIVIKNFPIVPEEIVIPLDYQPKAVVHVGAHARSRGCGVMIEAFDLVVQQIPDARLWLVGPFNHPPYQKEVEQLISRRNLQNVAKLVGEVPYPEALKWVSRAAVGLIAYQAVSQYQECLPTKVLEYMAAGIPVVATDVPANRNIIEAADCGYLVEPAAPQAYAEAIIDLLTHPDKAKQLGLNGRRAVFDRYDWRMEEKKLLSTYSSIENGQALVGQPNSSMRPHIVAE